MQIQQAITVTAEFKLFYWYDFKNINLICILSWFLLILISFLQNCVSTFLSQRWNTFKQEIFVWFTINGAPDISRKDNYQKEQRYQQQWFEQTIHNFNEIKKMKLRIYLYFNRFLLESLPEFFWSAGEKFPAKQKIWSAREIICHQLFEFFQVLNRH